MTTHRHHADEDSRMLRPARGALAGIVLAGLAFASPPVRAQDAPAPAPGAAEAEDLAAETAYLRALFAERELRDFAKAGEGYAAAAATKGARHEIVGRALLGRMRCLAALGNASEAGALRARLETEFADVGDVATALAAAQPGTGDARERIVALVGAGRTDEAAAWGDRAVPVLAGELRRDDPEVVEAAARALAMVNSPAAWAALEGGLRDAAVLHPGATAPGVASADAPGAPDSIIETALGHSDGKVRAAACEALLVRDGPGEARAALVARAVTIPEMAGALDRAAPPVQAVLPPHLLPSGPADAVVVAALASDTDAVRAAATRWVQRSGVGVVGRLWNADAATVARDDSARAVVERLARIQNPKLVAPVSDAVIDAAIRTGSHAEALQFLAGAAREPGPGDRARVLATFRALAPRAFAPSSGASDGEARASASGGRLLEILPSVEPGVLGARLLRVLGPEMSADDVAGVLSGWPWDTASMRTWLDASLARGDVTRLGLAPFLPIAGDETPPASASTRWDWAVRRLGAGALPAGSADALLRSIAEHPAGPAAEHAIAALRVWPSPADRVSAGTVGDAAAVAPTSFAPLGPWIAPGADRKLADAALSFLGKFASQPAARAALEAAATPAHPRFLTALEIGARSRAPWARDALRAGRDAGVVSLQVFIGLAARLDGPAAAPEIRRAIESTSPDDTRPVALAFDAVAESAVRLGGEAPALLAELLRRFPASIHLTLDPQDQVLASQAVLQRFDTDGRRLVLEAALGTKSQYTQAWAARLAERARDPGLLDALTAAARAAVPDVRAKLLEAISATEREQQAMADGETRKRVRTLIASQNPEERRAGIAGAVATRSRALVPEILRIAVEDFYPEVRAEARSALVALGAMWEPAPAVAAPGSGSSQDR